MKKIVLVLILFLASLLFIGCSSETSNANNTDLSNFIQAYEDEGVEIDPNDKPFFQMIEAKDGVIFYMDGDKVAIYEYESGKSLKEAMKNNAMLSDWIVNGKFLLETSNETAKDIFTSVN